MSRSNVVWSVRGRALVLGTALAISTLAASGAWAHGMRPDAGPQGPGMGAPMGPLAGVLLHDPAHLDRRLERLGERLNLQPEQRTQLRSIAQRTAQDVAPLREQAQQLRDERRRLWTQPTLDEAAITALRERSTALHAQLAQRIEQGLLEAVRVLTPEQRQRLAAFTAQRGAHRHGGHGEGHPHRRHREPRDLPGRG